MAQPMHVQQLLKLKQQAVQQQKAIQPQAGPGPAAVQQKVLASCGGSRPSCLCVMLGPTLGHRAHGGRGRSDWAWLAAWYPCTGGPGLGAMWGLEGWAALLPALVESGEGGRHIARNPPGPGVQNARSRRQACIRARS